MHNQDTISAPATAAGQGSIGIIRLSGGRAIEIAEKMFKSPKGKLVQDASSFTALYGHIVDNERGSVIDEALLLIMRSPSSYTMEDVAEFHCHGGTVPLRETLDLTLRMGARLAQPGEFTKRAFLNGRIDLTQAEAVIDVIRSKTDASLKAAVNNLSGKLSERIHSTREGLLRIIAQLEAAIDFPEEDIESLSLNQMVLAIEKAQKEINRLLDASQTGRILREGLKTAIVGKPNVGKSSLLNALVGENRAIVTDIAGTTRDVIEEYINIEGIPLCIMDTAGIRKTSDVVEKLGVEKAKKVWEEANLALLLLDYGAPLRQDDLNLLVMLKNMSENNQNITSIIILNKCDLPQGIDLSEVMRYAGQSRVLKVSAKNLAGLDQLKEAIVNLCRQGEAASKDAVFVSNVRQIELLRQADTHLKDALAAIQSALPIDCIVLDIKLSWEKLGEITGSTVSEDILEQIFSQFCIGK